MTPQTRTSLKELQQLDQEIATVRSASHGFEPLLEEVDAPVLRLEQEVEALDKRLKEIKLEENRIELTIEERRVRSAQASRTHGGRSATCGKRRPCMLNWRWSGGPSRVKNRRL